MTPSAPRSAFVQPSPPPGGRAPQARASRRRTGLRGPRRAAALALALLAGCGGDAPAPAAPARPTSTRTRADTESFPIRHLFVEAREKPRSPTKGPRTRDEALARAQEAVRRLRAPGADFAAVARELSDDDVTAASEGFGGFRSRWNGDEPAVVEAARALPVGGVSDPVASPLGFHVLQRLSREEGKALEARLVAPMEGLLFRWTELDPQAETKRTRAEAYADASAAVAALRAGQQVAELLPSWPGVRTYLLPMARGATPGWEAFIEQALAAPVDAWIGPTETGDGWAVARRQPYVRAIVRHLVVTHQQSAGSAKGTRMPEEAHALAVKCRYDLEADPSAWDRLVETFSDEPGSRVVGGFLGEFTTVAEPRQRFAPEIEQAVRALKPGERSDVVESRFGFHVFWRVD